MAFFGVGTIYAVITVVMFVMSADPKPSALHAAFYLAAGSLM